jgi:hypothetical protein
MALFTLVLLVQVLLPGPMGYDKWAGIFSAQWMKVLTFVVIVSLLACLGRHARHLDGLRQARGPAPGAAGVHHRVAGRLRRLGPAGALEALNPYG